MVDRIKIPTTTTTVPPLWQYCSMVMSATFADRSPMVRPETMMPKMTMPMATFEHDHARLPLTFMSLVSRAIRCFSQWSTMSVTCSTVHRRGASVVVACTCQCVYAVHVDMQCACVSVSMQCTCTCSE